MMHQLTYEKINDNTFVAIIVDLIKGVVLYRSTETFDSPQRAESHAQSIHENKD